MEKLGINVERRNLVYLAYGMENTLAEADPTIKIVLSLPGLIPFCMKDTEHALEFINNLYATIGSSSLYFMETSMVDDRDVEVRLDGSLLTVGWTDSEIQEVDREQRASHGDYGDSGTWMGE